VAKGGVAFIPADRLIFPGLTVEENLKLAERQSTGMNVWNLERIYKYFPILAARKKQDGATLSGGEQQMLAIGRGLMCNPIIMLLDEPSQGLAPLVIKTVVEIVIELCKEGNLTLLLVEQNFRVAMKLASRHYLMDIKGIIKCDLNNQECVENKDILTKHLSV
jgi:branched-chain amino acid transport system ATP-binding protein